MRNMMKRFALFLSMFFFLLIYQDGFAKDKTMSFSTHLKKDSVLFETTYDILNEAFRRMGYRFQMISYPALRALSVANAGKTDGEAHRIYGIEKDYPNLVRVPGIQMVISNYAYSLKPIPLKNGWIDLNSYKVGVRRGSIFVTEMARKHAKEVHELDDHKCLFRFLMRGRADVVINAPAQVKVMLGSSEFSGKNFIRNEPPLTKVLIFTYLHQKHNPLVSVVAQKLHEMKTDGSYAKIMEKLKF